MSDELEAITCHLAEEEAADEEAADEEADDEEADDEEEGDDDEEPLDENLGEEEPLEDDAWECALCRMVIAKSNYPEHEVCRECCKEDGFYEALQEQIVHNKRLTRINRQLRNKVRELMQYAPHEGTNQSNKRFREDETLPEE
jgi:hypothetical protein